MITINSTEYSFPEFRDLDAVKAESRRLGSHFFSAGAMRFFNSRISATVYGGRFIVTSEKREWNTPRRYTVRMAYHQIDDLGYETFQMLTVPPRSNLDGDGFQAYASLSGAAAAAESWARDVRFWDISTRDAGLARLVANA